MTPPHQAWAWPSPGGRSRLAEGRAGHRGGESAGCQGGPPLSLQGPPLAAGDSVSAPCPCAAVLRQSRKGRSPLVSHLLKDEEGQVTFSWGRGLRLRSCPWSSAPHPLCGLVPWALVPGHGTTFRGLQAPSWTQVWGSAGEDPGPGYPPQPAVAGTCICHRFNPKGPDTPCPPNAGWGVGHTMAQGRPFRLPGTWAGPARRQHGQGLPPHMDRWTWCKPLAVGTKSLSPSARASISSWCGQRAPVPCCGTCGSRNVWSPFSAPKSWLEAGPGRALKLWHHRPQQPRCPAGTPGEVVWRAPWRGVGLWASRTKRKTQPPRAQPTQIACLPRAMCGALRGIVSEGSWPGRRVASQGAGAHSGESWSVGRPCPRPDTAQSKHGPRERGPGAHLLRVPSPCRQQRACACVRMCDIRP